jgi:hypothetical protein
MNTIVTAVAVTPSTPNLNKKQKLTAKEERSNRGERAVQALIEQLEQGHSEALTAYLTAMGSACVVDARLQFIGRNLMDGRSSRGLTGEDWSDEAQIV